jgi:hypothetical protein
VSGSGYQNIITIDLVDDPILTDNNKRYFKKISKEMYNFTLVRHDYSSASIRYRIACLNLPPYAGSAQALTKENQKTEGSCEWPPGARCKRKTHIREQTKNIYLQREHKLNWSGRERRGSSRTISAILRRQTPSSKNNLKNKRRRTKASPFFPRVLSLNNYLEF